MARDDIERVLANWIGRAMSPVGELDASVDPAEWVAEKFIAWWRKQVAESLDYADESASSLREELIRLNEPERLGEARHALIHVRDALSDLRAELGLIDSSDDQLA